MNITKIYDQVKRCYNNANDFYNKGDYATANQLLRTVFENLPRIIVHDLYPEECDDILCGKKVFTPSDIRESSSLTNTDQFYSEGELIEWSKKPSYYNRRSMIMGSTIIKIGLNAMEYFFYKNMDKQKKIYFNKYIKADFFNMLKMFASGNNPTHANEQRDISKDITREAFPLLIGFIDRLKPYSILKKESLKTLSIVNDSETNNFENIDIKQNILVNNAYAQLDSYTDNFSDHKFILLSKPNLGKELGLNGTKVLFRVNWNMVVDFNSNSCNELHSLAMNLIPSNINIITKKNRNYDYTQINDGSYKINWVFAKGRVDDSSQSNSFNDWRGKYLATISQCLKQLRKECNVGSYIYLCFLNEDEDLEYVRVMIEKIAETHNYDDNEYKVIVLYTNLELKENLENTTKHDSVVFINITASQLISYIKDNPSIGEEIYSDLDRKDFSLFVNGLEHIVRKDILNTYREIGIEFVDDRDNDKNTEDDFYAGGEISWQDLRDHKDVMRKSYESFLASIIGRIRSLKNTERIYLAHQAGAGGTTYSRRLAYDVDQKNRHNVINCNVVLLKKFTSRKTIDSINRIYDALRSNPLLVIAEAHMLGNDSELNQINLRLRGRDILFLIVDHKNGNNKNALRLRSSLDREERPRFITKYSPEGLTNDKILRLPKNPEVIDFPLLTKDNAISDEVLDYVNNIFTDITDDDIKELCILLAFASYFSGLAININLLKSLWIKKFPSWRACLNKWRKQFNCLFISERNPGGNITDKWKPRYSRFSEFILKTKYKENWNSGAVLAKLASAFLEVCKSAGELGYDDQNVFMNIFINRGTTDWTTIDDNVTYNRKFSTLIEHIARNDDNQALLITKTLAEDYNDNSYFVANYGRFVFEKISQDESIGCDDPLYEESLKYIEAAINITSDDESKGKLFHMKGVFFRRKIKALSREIKNRLANNNESIDKRKTEQFEIKLFEFMENGEDAFNESINKDPLSAFGYTDKAKLYRDVIKCYKEMYHKSDYHFCEQSDWDDIIQNMSKDIENLWQICKTLPKDIPSNKMAYNYYLNLRNFQYQILSSVTDHLDYYYKQCNDKNNREGLQIKYGKFYYDACLYSEDKRLTRSQIFKNLPEKERQRIILVVKRTKDLGDKTSYHKLFDLYLWDDVDYDLEDEIIPILNEWKQDCKDDEREVLEADYRLAICYAILTIDGDKLAKEKAEKYFKMSEKLSEKIYKGSNQRSFYLGKGKGIHAILEKNFTSMKKNYEAEYYPTARSLQGFLNTEPIGKNNKVQLECGLEATIRIERDDLDKIKNGSTIFESQLIGFKYSGIGFYGKYIINPNQVSDQLQLNTISSSL